MSKVNCNLPDFTIPPAVDCSTGQRDKLPSMRLEAVQIVDSDSIKQIDSWGWIVHLDGSTYQDPAGGSDVIYLNKDGNQLLAGPMDYFVCLNGKHFFVCSIEEFKQLFNG
jgi:hypothetical protein